MSKHKTSKTERKPGRGPDLKAGKYSDGHPLDEIQRLECKLILKPDRFTSAKVFKEFGALVSKSAKTFGVGFSTKGPEARGPGSTLRGTPRTSGCTRMRSSCGGASPTRTVSP